MMIGRGADKPTSACYNRLDVKCTLGNFFSAQIKWAGKDQERKKESCFEQSEFSFERRDMLMQCACMSHPSDTELDIVGGNSRN